MPFNDGQAPRYYRHSDPLAVWLHQQLAPSVAALVDEPVKPSYTFAGSYVAGGDLKPHTGSRAVRIHAIAHGRCHAESQARECLAPVAAGPARANRIGAARAGRCAAVQGQGADAFSRDARTGSHIDFAVLSFRAGGFCRQARLSCAMEIRTDIVAPLRLRSAERNLSCGRRTRAADGSALA